VVEYRALLMFFSGRKEGSVDRKEGLFEMLTARYSRLVLQCVAVCCSVLQCVAVCCSEMLTARYSRLVHQFCANICVRVHVCV